MMYKNSDFIFNRLFQHSFPRTKLKRPNILLRVFYGPSYFKGSLCWPETHFIIVVNYIALNTNSWALRYGYWSLVMSLF